MTDVDELSAPMGWFWARVQPGWQQRRGEPSSFLVLVRVAAIEAASPDPEGLRIVLQFASGQNIPVQMPLADLVAKINQAN